MSNKMKEAGGEKKALELIEQFINSKKVGTT